MSASNLNCRFPVSSPHVHILSGVSFKVGVCMNRKIMNEISGHLAACCDCKTILQNHIITITFCEGGHVVCLEMIDHSIS